MSLYRGTHRGHCQRCGHIQVVLPNGTLAQHGYTVPNGYLKYRPQRGGLKESMAEVVEIEPSLDALAIILKTPASTITVEPYTYDARIEWDTYIVCVNGRAVGFTNVFVESPL